jgi:hypothetical protein
MTFEAYFRQSTVTKEEGVYIVVSVASNSTNNISTQLAWDFIKKNWTLFNDRFYDSTIFGRLIKGVIQNFSNDEVVQDIRVSIRIYENFHENGSNL